MHLMSPRCKDKGNIKRAFIPQTRLFFPVFTLSLPNENSVYCFRKHISRTRHSRHLPAVTAYYSFSITYRRTLFQRVAPIIQLVAESPALRSIHPQFPGKQGNTAPRQDYLPCADVGNDALLHLFPDSASMGENPSGTNSGRRHQLAHWHISTLIKLLPIFRRILPTPSEHRQACLPNVSRSFAR